MKQIEIIDCLTTMGNTEGTGVIETPENPHEMYDFIKQWFGGDCDGIVCDSELKTATKYIYSYDVHLFGSKCIYKEDCKIEIEWESAEDNEHLQTDVDRIYLYEIE
jgi:hypothetical protein